MLTRAICGTNSLESLILIRLHDRSLSNSNFLRSPAFLVPLAHKLALKNRYKLCTIAQLTFLSFLAVCTEESPLRTVTGNRVPRHSAIRIQRRPAAASATSHSILRGATIRSYKATRLQDWTATGTPLERQCPNPIQVSDRSNPVPIAASVAIQ
jgi:hypothetical protein